MGFSSQPEPVLDQRFFQITGIAMVLGTIVAGVITVWLANETGVAQTPVLMTSNIEASLEPDTFVGPVTEANFRIHVNKMVFNPR